MIRASMNLKIAVVIVSAALLLTFSRQSFSLLLPGIIGIALILFGIVIGYRPAAVLGLFVNLAVAALSVEISTMADMDIWQTSILGLLVPTSLLAWGALLSEQSDSYEIRLRTRPFAAALAVGAIFAAALPVSAVLTGLLSPALTDTLSTMAEISILFVVIAITVLISTWASDEVPSGKIVESI